ncbi:MAG: ATP-binding protein [Myxococcota bacterium]
MPTRFYPHADPACSRCHGLGYVVTPQGEFAQAAVCDCVPHCLRCGGSGRITITRGDDIVVGRCRCQMLPDRIRLFNRANIPARHANSSFMSFDKSADGVMPGFFAAMSWVQDFSPGEENQGMIFWGSVGRGKTHLLIATLRQLVFEHGVAVRFVEFSRLLSILKEGYSAGRSDTPVLEDLSQVPVLGIDEIGKGRLSEWELTIIDEVVSRRYNAMSCILGSTNYSPAVPSGNPPANLAVAEFEKQTLGDRVGHRVFSRLQQMCIFVQARGNDYRLVEGRRMQKTGPRLTPLPGGNAT